MNIMCSGPGPHLPASGVIGTSDRPVTGMLCSSDACQAAVLASQAAAVTADANATTLRTRAQAALTANATFLGLASPTNAQLVAQVQLLTKESSALIRLVLGQLDSTSGA